MHCLSSGTARDNTRCVFWDLPGRIVAFSSLSSSKSRSIKTSILLGRIKILRTLILSPLYILPAQVKKAKEEEKGQKDRHEGFYGRKAADKHVSHTQLFHCPCLV